MGDQRLRPVERLRCPRAFQRVFEQGEKLVGSLFILYVLPTSEPYSRLGMAVSKRIGNAVVRNRIKRYLREMFRRHKAFLLSSCDFVCVARREAVGVPLALYMQQFLSLLQRCSALDARGKGGKQ
jgi:ribonuclease P protein component